MAAGQDDEGGQQDNVSDKVSPMQMEMIAAKCPCIEHKAIHVLFPQRRPQEQSSDPSEGLGMEPGMRFIKLSTSASCD
jgi:hypothetical protein